jgi:hypothetical protein
MQVQKSLRMCRLLNLSAHTQNTQKHTKGKCIEDPEQDGGDIVDRSAQATTLLRTCMDKSYPQLQRAPSSASSTP